MRWKWLSLLPFCLGTQTGQHTRDPVSYCLSRFSPHPFQPIGPNGPGRRGGTSSSSAKPWQMGRDSPLCWPVWVPRQKGRSDSHPKPLLGHPWVIGRSFLLSPINCSA